MSELAVFWHDDVLLHDTGAGLFETGPNELLDEPELHPENDVRIRNMRSLLTRGPLAPHLDWRDGRHATEAELALVHDPAYVTSIKRQMAAGGGRLEDGYTVISEHSWRAATAAAGTALAAADAVLEGDTRVSLALVRPPGHHAQPAVADGYCFFNNAALAAERARRAGIERVAVVDWDVHHGNGTQECFYDRRDVLTVSLHMRTGLWSPTHVQTGSPEEVGRDAGQGFNVNVELPVGSGDQAYELAMRRIVAPVLEQFRPGLIVGAGGQDASGFDPNGRQNVSMDGFRAIGAAARGRGAGAVRRPARARPGGRLRAHLRRVLPPRHARGRARAGAAARRPARLHPRRLRPAPAASVERSSPRSRAIGGCRCRPSRRRRTRARGLAPSGAWSRTRAATSRG